MERQTKRNAMLQSVLVHKLGLPSGRTMIGSGAHESKASGSTGGKFALKDLSDLLPTWSSSDQNVDAQPVVRSLATLCHRCRASLAVTQKSARSSDTDHRSLWAGCWPAEARHATDDERCRSRKASGAQTCAGDAAGSAAAARRGQGEETSRKARADLPTVAIGAPKGVAAEPSIACRALTYTHAGLRLCGRRHSTCRAAACRRRSCFCRRGPANATRWRSTRCHSTRWPSLSTPDICSSPWVRPPSAQHLATQRVRWAAVIALLAIARRTATGPTESVEGSTATGCPPQAAGLFGLSGEIWIGIWDSVCAALLTAVLPPPIFGKRKCCWGRCWGVAIEQPAVKQSGASVRRAQSSAAHSRCIYSVRALYPRHASRACGCAM